MAQTYSCYIIIGFQKEICHVNKFGALKNLSAAKADLTQPDFYTCWLMIGRRQVNDSNCGANVHDRQANELIFWQVILRNCRININMHYRGADRF